MKLDLGKRVRILGQLIVAAPVIIAAVKPAVDAVKAPKKTGG